MAIGFVGQLGGAGGSAGAAAAIDYGVPVQDVAELRAVPPDLRGDKQQRLVEDKGVDYRFDAGAVGADDGDLIIEPTVGTGRWFKTAVPAGGMPTAHDLGGSEHIADTILDLNSKISDAQIDPSRIFLADQLSHPNNADWVVNALAPAVADPNNPGFTVSLLDDTIEEGVGLEDRPPAGALNILITTVARAKTGPAGAVVGKMRVYNRGVPDAAAVEAWPAATNMNDVDLPITTEFFHYDTTTIALATLGMTAGELTQLEITRNSPDGGDTLVGDMALLAIFVRYT